MLSCVGPCLKTTPGELAYANGGVDVEVKPAFPVSQGHCSKCREPSTVEACPTCHGVIPAQWRQEPAPLVQCVAMAGARSTGKSLYIGVLKQQLELFVSEVVGKVLNELGDTEAQYQERYGNRIFVERKILGATLELTQDPASGQPLIFEFKGADDRSRILVLRDVAGEDLQKLRERKARLNFLTRADAIVMLLDPLKIEDIRAVLKGKAQHGELGGDGIELLRNLLDFLKEAQGKPKTPTPIAVTLSKADYLQAVRETNSPLRALMARPGSPLQRDPSMSEVAFDKKDSDLLQLEIDSLLQFLTGQTIRNLLRESTEVHRYFAVSSLGGDAVGEDIRDAGIAPYRVLDPVKWILRP